MRILKSVALLLFVSCTGWSFDTVQVINSTGNPVNVRSTGVSSTTLSQFPPAFLLSDTVSNPTTTASAAMVYGWSGTVWDRAKASGDNADALTTSGVGHLQVISHNTGFNGTTWDRLRSTIANGLQVDVTRTQGITYVAFSSAPTTNIYSSTMGVTGVAISTPIAGLSSQTVRIFMILITVDADTTINFQDGATNFGSQYPMSAKGSISRELRGNPHYITSSGNGFVINQSGTAKISYEIFYTQS